VRLHPCERARPLRLTQRRHDDSQHISKWLKQIANHDFDSAMTKRLADDFRDIHYRAEGRDPPDDCYSSAQINLCLQLMGDWLDPLLDVLLEFK
jgi:hypothetical protein